MVEDVQSDWPRTDVDQSTVSVVSQRGVLRHKPMFHSKLPRHIHMSIPILQQHPHIPYWPNAPRQSPHTVLAMELIKCLPERGFFVTFLIGLRRLLGSSRSICASTAERTGAR